MIDLKEYVLISRKDDDAVLVQHASCGDLNTVANLDEAVQWAGEHVCGQ